jgi:hypothetical protein
MENIIRTALGAQLQTCQLLGIPRPVDPYTTLNEKFDISAEIELAPSDIPKVQYIGIGNGGHRMVVGGSGLTKPEPVQHKVTDTGMFNQLPFVLRRTDNDLSSTDRAKYRLRKFETHDSVQYIAYYLKALDLSATECVLEKRSIKDGVVVTSPFTYSNSDLAPVPPDITPTEIITTTGEYIVATAKVPFIMDTGEIDEYLNVCRIIYGDDSYAMISEIALCAGADRLVSGIVDGLSTTYTEAIGVQITSFINSFYALKFSNDRIQLLLDIGSTEAMLNLT